MNSKKNEYANQINQAVAILRDNNERVTVRAISDLTGIHIQTLYQQEAVRSLVRVHAKKTIAKESPAARIAVIHEKEIVSQDVESYMVYIKDNYFSHADSFEDVIHDMRSNIVDFKIDLFNLAKNKLLLSKELKALAHSDTLFIADLKQVVSSEGVESINGSACDDELGKILRLAYSDNPFANLEDEDKDEFVIFNESLKEYEKIFGSAMVDKRIEFLLKEDDHVLKIYKLVEVAQPVRKITRHKII